MKRSTETSRPSTICTPIVESELPLSVSRDATMNPLLLWEWGHDWYDGDDYSGDAVDPWGYSSGSTRVLKGGSWTNNPQYLRSALRTRIDPAYDDMNVGFRLARSE